MTSRERYLETLLFGAPDRIPLDPGGGRESTLRAWHSQGLPEGADYSALCRALVDARRAQQGLPPGDYQPSQPYVDAGVSFQMHPKFDEKVLEHKDGHYIVQDWMGAITEISDEYDYTYIRYAKDFVTRKWHKFPVESWDDWERMKERFNPKDPARHPVDFADRCARLRERDYLFTLRFSGPFWQLREFCGMEGLCMLMLEQPDLVRDMAAFWTEFVSRVLEPILDQAPPDVLSLSEDLAFKEHPMIGPEMLEDFFGLAYRRWGEEAKAAGVPLYEVDSDGRIDLVIPVWMDCGVNLVTPIEIAAGNNLSAMRETFGRKMAYRGGVDKRAIAAGGDALVNHLVHMAPIVRGGGFIPSCDHAVPADVSWPRYQEYVLLLAELTGWLKPERLPL